MNLNSDIKFDLDYKSVKQICGPSKQTVVYGWKRCEYRNIMMALEHCKSPIKIFDYALGKPDIQNTTLEGYEFSKIPVNKLADTEEKLTSRYCKNAIVNLILENYKRKKLGLNIIPLIFCIDIEGNNHPSTATTICSREPFLNELITHSELRRCYKLCNENTSDEIKTIANETIKFVKVTIECNAQAKKITSHTKNIAKLIEIPPFWESDDWHNEWYKRQRTKEIKPEKPEKYRWRAQLAKKVESYNKAIADVQEMQHQPMMLQK
jgi:hypothetical protein